MAFVQSKYCPVCEEHRGHINGKCRTCAKREKRERVAKWNSLTDEEKFKDLRKRIEEIESRPPTY